MRRLCFNLLISLISISLCLLISEAIVRELALAPEVQRINFESPNSAFEKSENPVLGYEIKKSFKAEKEYPDYRFSTNSWGQRDRERELLPIEGKTRIIMLGDSIVMGLCLSNLHEVLPNMLESQLWPEFEVLNFGVTGYSPPAEVELLRTKGVNFRPKLVIWVLSDNDTDRANKGLAFLPSRSNVFEALVLKSSLFRLAVHLAGDINKFTILDGREIAKENVRVTSNTPLSLAFVKMKELSKEYKFSVLVVSWPVFDHDIFHSKHLYSEKSGNLIYEDLSQKMGFLYYDLKDQFISDWKEKESAEQQKLMPRLLYAYDSMHPNVNGSRTASKFIKEFLLKNRERLF